MMFRLLLLVATLLAALLAPMSARAQEAQPGDACATADHFRISGGPETGGKGYVMTCQGGVWVRSLETDTAGKVGVKQAAPAATLHVGGEAIIGSTGLACSGTTEGALRWDATNNLMEVCDGANWAPLVALGMASSDPLPNAFSFTDLTDQAISTLIYSNTLNITGFDGPVLAEVTGSGSPQLQINGGAWVTSGTINPGDSLRLRQTSSSSPNTAVVAAVTVGTGVDNWSVTTRPGQVRGFITTSTYNGNLGGIDGADAKCQTEAGAFGYSGNWKALISDTTTAAQNRLTMEYPFVRANPTTTVIDSTNLWTLPLNDGFSDTTSLAAWTGTNTDGTYALPNCLNWTSASTTQSGVIGYADRTDYGWVAWQSDACNNNRRLYCIEQDTLSFNAKTNVALDTLIYSNIQTVAVSGAVSISGGGSPQFQINGGSWVTSGSVSPGDTVRLRLTSASSINTLRTAAVTIAGSPYDWDVTTQVWALRTFATSATWTGNLGGLDGADAKCQTEADAAGYGGSWKAIISDSTTAASDRLNLGYAIVAANPTSRIIESSNLWGNSLENNYNWSTDLWTGTGGNGSSLSSNCQDWTSSSSTLSGVHGHANNSNSGWVNNGTSTCNTARRLYCIEQTVLSFNAKTNVPVNTLVNSNTVTVNASGAVSISGAGSPEFQVNGGSWVTSGSVSPGDTVRLRLTSASAINTLRTATVTIAGTPTAWNVTTQVWALRSFITGGTWTGNLGGVDGADDKCQTEADGAAYGGVWKAIISDSTTEAKDRLTLSYPIVRASTLTTTIETSNLWGSSLENSYGWSVFVWTGANADGTHELPNCNDWASSVSTLSGGVGHGNDTSSSWADSTLQTCDSTQQLYCIEQKTLTFDDETNAGLSAVVVSNAEKVIGAGGAISISGTGSPEFQINGGSWVTSGTVSAGDTLRLRLTSAAAINTTRSATVTIGSDNYDWTVTTRAWARRVFITSPTYQGNFGSLAAADAICQSEASGAGYSGTWKAILSSSASNAKDRLTIAYPIVRANPTTTVVESTNLWASSLEADFGSGVYVWTGTDAFGNYYSAATCSDWTSSSSGVSGRRGYGGDTDGRWVSNSSQTCDNVARFMCIDGQ